MTGGVPAAGIEKFRALLAGEPRQRIEREQLWRHFDTAFPGRPPGTEERRWLVASLEALAGEGVLRLPSTRGDHWDRTLQPPVPSFVLIQRARPEPRDDHWRRHPWHPALAWVPTCATLTSEQVRFLERVQAGLRDHEFEDPAPLKYRSLALTGDEKRLQQHAAGALFRPGRLTFELLGCLPERLPLAVETVAAVPAVVVVENAGPYEVMRRVLMETREPRYGLVAFGDGARAEHALPRLATREPAVGRVEYVGDLDRAGLRIAIAAARAVARAGLPALVPAEGLHAAMLSAAAALGHPGGWPTGPEDGQTSEHERDGELVSWLPEDVRVAVLAMLRAGRRIPEEVLGPRELRAVWTVARAG